MKTLLGCLILALTAGWASADVPYPPLCSVEPADQLNGILIAPGGSDERDWHYDEEIHIRNELGLPIPDVDVHVEFHVDGMRYCADCEFEARTEPDGSCRIRLRGSGCSHFRGGRDDVAVTIYADGMVIREYVNVKSPDFNGADSDLEVSLGDFAFFASSFAGLCDPCADYDNSGNVDLGDFAIFSTAWGERCN